MSWSLSDAICRVGIPSAEIGTSAARQGLVKITDGEGTTHFEWRKEALDRLSARTLESILKNLREAAGAAQLQGAAL